MALRTHRFAGGYENDRKPLILLVVCCIVRPASRV